MDRLSSCYFCGTALDASLSEYPVVPRALQPAGTDGRSVVLCPTCRRKLATIVESVVAAAGEGSPEDGVTGDAETLPSAADDEDLTGMLDESGMEPRPDPMDLSDANETEDDSESPVATGSHDDPNAGTEPASGSSDRAVDETRTDTATDGTDDGPAPNRASENGQPTEPSREREESSEESPTGSTASDTDESEQSDDGEADDGQGLTRLEYNKVMRLLQNRELPVDRSEIQAVAVNAYEIEPGEFDTIVDAAIDRDLIDERDGQIVSPE
ncbi:hypothetical protein [Haloarcula halophila]|uniref:hypothetical protein n=1 Tax=Haloarcula TaxID=2237 RepID=UPI0023E3A2E9|nr:hypothetical protein [Halomicroarcula sp. DFY41]